MRQFLTLLSALALGACATTERNPTTLDSGIPLNEAQQQFDVLHFTIRTDVNEQSHSISGSSEIRVVAVSDLDTVELDFDGLFKIDSVRDLRGELEYRRSESKLWVDLRESLPAGAEASITVAYRGKPRVAPNPPWDGGFQWAETPSGDPWIATSFQGQGCDVWFPCKDHPSGEPALGVDLYITVDDELTAASNGMLIGVEPHDNDRHTFHWQSKVRTNTYGIALNIGPYVLFEQSYTSINGTEFPVMFWAIDDHEEDARDLFDREFIPTVEFFERVLGPYPWAPEKLGVAETAHLGMEHQTINAYGNEFRRGRYGYDWLFHHELAHEWFANLLTNKTKSDMWLHEGLGTYMQPLYTREVLGDAAFFAQMLENYRRIEACNPIAPDREVSNRAIYFDVLDASAPGGDIYSKGSWVAHSLRYVLGDDRFFDALRILLYDTATPETLKAPIEARYRSTDDFVQVASGLYGEDLGWFFDVYVRRGPLPELSVSDTDGNVLLEWVNTGDTEFPMPVPVRINGEIQRVEFEGNRAKLEGVSSGDMLIDPFMQVLRKLSIVPTCEERRAESSPTN